MIKKLLRKWLGIEKDKRILEARCLDNSYEKQRLYQIEDVETGYVLIRGLSFQTARRQAVSLAGSRKSSLGKFGPIKTLRISSNIGDESFIISGPNPEGTRPNYE